MRIACVAALRSRRSMRASPRCGGGASGVRAGGAGAAERPLRIPSFAAYAAAHGIETLNGGGGGDAPEVTADGLRLELLDKDKPVKLDGVLNEWPAPAKANVVIKGSGAKAGLEDLAAVRRREALRRRRRDRRVVRRQGRTTCRSLLAVPQPGGGYATYDVGPLRGQAGRERGERAVRAAQRRIPGAKIVEAPDAGRLQLRGDRALVGAPGSADDARRHPRRRALLRRRRTSIAHGPGRRAAPRGDAVGPERAGALDDRAASHPEEPDQDGARRSTSSPTSRATACASASPSSTTT